MTEKPAPPEGQSSEQTENLAGSPQPRLVRPFHVGDRVSFLNGKRRGYGTIYAETPERKNSMGITEPQQISVCTGHPRYQKFAMDVDFAAVRLCRTNA